MRVPHFVLPAIITVAATIAALAALTIAAPAAYASISGPCDASINGQDVKGLSTGPLSKPIDVEKDAQVPVTMSAGATIDHLKIEMEFAGIRWTVHDEATDGTSWAKTVNVKDYAKYGAGLYKVIGASSGQSVSCSGAALVRVKENPLTTVAGAGAAGLAVLGVAGIAAGAFGATDLKTSGDTNLSLDAPAGMPRSDASFLYQRYSAPPRPDLLTNPIGYFCGGLIPTTILLTSLAMIGVLGTQPAPGGGTPPGGPPPPTIPDWMRVPVPRLQQRPKISIVGLFGGLLAGLGVVVLLQQYGKVYPTAGVAIAGVVGGLLLGVLVPTLARMVAVNRANRRIAVIEAWLIAQRQGRPAPPPQP